jgi:hypothetical protein
MTRRAYNVVTSRVVNTISQFLGAVPSLVALDLVSESNIGKVTVISLNWWFCGDTTKLKIAWISYETI